MPIPILTMWEKYFTNHDEGLGSTYERFMINEVLFKAIKHYRVKSVLETPSFGTTGVSGINSLGLALEDIAVTINDNDRYRLDLIKKVWSEIGAKATFDYVEDFSTLPYKDSSFDMAWNFSALWHIADLDKFLSELSRVTRKIIIIMVPNTAGLGYMYLKHIGKEDIARYLKEENIAPATFIPTLRKLGWKLMHDDFVDCPIWPDIGMSKEDFLKKINCYDVYKKFIPEKKAEKKSEMTILNYYNGCELDMKKDMEKYAIFERKSPQFFKTFWAHHKYFLFLNTNE